MNKQKEVEHVIKKHMKFRVIKDEFFLQGDKVYNLAYDIVKLFTKTNVNNNEIQKEQNIPVNNRYFIIRRYNSGTSSNKTDIIGITSDEEYAKSVQSVFCDYEEVKMIP